MSEICIIVTIVVYLAAMLLVGFAYSKTNNDSADFYLGGREDGGLVTAYERRGQRYVQLAADGYAGSGLSDRHCLAGLDGHRPCAGYLAQLAHRGPAAPPLFGQPRRHHGTAVLVASLP